RRERGDGGRRGERRPGARPGGRRDRDWRGNRRGDRLGGSGAGEQRPAVGDGSAQAIEGRVPEDGPEPGLGGWLQRGGDSAGGGGAGADRVRAQPGHRGGDDVAVDDHRGAERAVVAEGGPRSGTGRRPITRCPRCVSPSWARTSLTAAAT